MIRTHPYNKVVGILTTAILLCIAAVGLSVDVIDDQQFAQSVQHDIDELGTIASNWNTVEGAAALRDVMDRLRSAPSDVVVPQVVHALRHDPAFGTGQARRSAYGLLRDHQAALYDDGFEQMLLGLHDPDVASIAMSGLRVTPAWKYDQLMEAVIPLLEDNDLPQHRLTLVMGLLTKIGPQAASALPKIAEYYHDTDQEADIRMYAAQTMVHVGGVLWAIEQFGILNLTSAPPLEANAITWAFAVHATETEGTFDLEPHLRAFPRAIIRSAMKHEDKEIRGTAAYAFLNSYSKEERVVQIGENEFVMHPDLVQAFSDMAENDPDLDLRASAAQVLSESFPREIQRRQQVDQEHED